MTSLGDYKDTLTFGLRIPMFQSSERRLEMAKKAPGKSHREGITLVQLMDMFPTEEAATQWFESIIWPNGRHCLKCGSERTREASHKYMPYWCSDCRSYFSVKTGTAMQASKIPLRKWAIAIYLCLTSLKSVSSMKLQRDIGVSQPTAWFMLHRIREAWAGDDDDQLDGPAEVDETYIGGKRENMSLSKRKELAGTGRGAVGKTAVIGVKDRESGEVRAEVIENTDGPTLQGLRPRACRAGRDPLYGRGEGVQGDARVRSRGGQSQRRRVRRRNGAHQRHRELLVDAEAGAQGHLPQDQPEAS